MLQIWTFSIFVKACPPLEPPMYLIYISICLCSEKMDKALMLQHRLKKMPNIRHSIVCFHFWWRQTCIEILWEWGPPPLTLQGKFGHPPWWPCRIHFLGTIQPWVPELGGGGQIKFKILLTLRLSLSNMGWKRGRVTIDRDIHFLGWNNTLLLLTFFNWKKCSFVGMLKKRLPDTNTSTLWPRCWYPGELIWTKLSGYQKKPQQF